ncbi:DUF1415 domain-containing protein [Rhodoferax sp.]|uniref:DUF1415 domain-containing protein n=1 Tax=Rhodoferax sp. TaxID=50421 RepID=UPI0025D70C6E|nr:DUF1415 domain-containing protein [Rhodoferax sp.]
MFEANPHPAQTDAVVIARMRQWLQRAVIGLNLCPFAKAVYVKNQIHYVVCRATERADVLDILHKELLDLQATSPELRDTTLLILPEALSEFVDFNDFLYAAEKCLRKLKLSGELQIASFHPDFQFADVSADDISNFTNRAPYPVLHLLRESSIDKAVEAFPEAEQIYARNIATLKDLGADGWLALDVSANPLADSAPSK